MNNACCICGQESTHGCHGIKDGAVYSEYFCETHYNSNRRGPYADSEKVLLVVPEQEHGQTGSSSEAAPPSAEPGVPSEDIERELLAATAILLSEL